MLKILTQISRIIIGILFIYSGFVKLVDPIGSKIKFIEYFGADVLNLEFLTPFAMPLAILLIIAELVLGVMLIVGYLPKLTVWSLFGITLIFLFLTWYSYKYNKVTDCGCFGDALKISPKATFYKNVVFIALVAILIYGLRYIKPLPNLKFAKSSTFTSVVLSLIVIYYVLNHLPIIDFRAYSVGTDIKKGMQFGKNGEEPSIYDFMIETDEGDKLEEMLAKDKAMLIVMYNFENVDEEGVIPTSQVAKKAKEKGYEVYVLTASYIEDRKAVQEKYKLPYTFGFADETALKTVIRANPGIVTIEKGIITGKWNWTDAEDVILK